MRKDIMLFSPDVNEIEIDTKEAMRYMGIKGFKIEENLLDEIEKVKEDVKSATMCRSCYTVVDISNVSDSEIMLGGIDVKSRNLTKNLAGCKKAYIFAATIGANVDRLILKLSVKSPARSVMADALGSAAIEGFCNLLNEKLAKEATLCPRFSAGYGDMSLEYQKDILSLLECEKHIGLSLTESLMMTPTKSVTAIIGIKG